MLDSFTEKMSHHIKLNPTNSSYSALPFNSPRIDEGSSCPRMSEALPSYATKFNAIPRIHPIHLLSALLVGLLLSSGISYLNPSIHSAPLNVNQFRKNDYSIGPTNDGLLRTPTIAPSYTLHSSGHLFLSPSAILSTSNSSHLSIEAAAEARHAPAIRHPIHELIANATKIWEQKQHRQSKSLREAVVEYKRRHKRNPPKGFDLWYKFATSNDVVLIDEFDSIQRDLLPFYAIPPTTLARRSRILQSDPSTFTMQIQNGTVTITGTERKEMRAVDQAGLMKRWSHWVDDINITMSSHDGPSIMMAYEAKKLHEQAAEKGILLSERVLDTVDDDASLWGFQIACPPNSRFRRSYDGLESKNTLPPGPSFVGVDHVKTMDLCENPEWQFLHGFTAWPGMRPEVLLPLFSFAKTTLHSDILLTPLEQYRDTEGWDAVWEKKLFNRAVWRGSTTGIWFDRGTWWRRSQRVRLYFLSKDKTGSQKTRFDGVGVESQVGKESIVEREVKNEVLMNRYLDFAFSGKQNQCTQKDGTCDALKKVFEFERAMGWNEANEYKYMLDLDGNAWSGRFHRLLASNSAVLKSTIFPEWYSGWIQPWVHYIPIKVDYSDLFDVLAFFSGDLDGRNGHDGMAKQIAQQGKEYTEKFWRYEDMETYVFRLALEWARCSSLDRASMDYTGPGTE